VTIEGPAGIGKSSLLDEAHRVAAQAGLVVAAARSDELDQVIPVGALLAALGHSDPPVLLEPDLARLRTASHPREMEEFLRAVLETQLSAVAPGPFYRRLAVGGPNDLVPARPTPPALFSVPILWLLASRPGAAASPLQSLLSRLAGAGAVRLGLGALDAEAAAAVAADLLGGHPDPVLSGLLERAGGNPFYLVELVLALESEGRLRVRRRTAELVGAGVPGQFRIAVASHLRPLSAEAAQLLRVASVLGRDFSMEELAAVMSAPTARLLPALTEALRGEILAERDHLLGFRHDLLRQAVYDELPVSVRRSLHRDAARFLTQGGASPARIAGHLLISAVRGDAEAVDVLGRAALELLGPNPAGGADLARAALGLVADDDPRWPGLAATAVDLAGWAGRSGDTEALAAELRAAGPMDVTIEARVELGVRRSYVHSGRPTSQLPPLPGRLIDASDVPPRLRASLLLVDGTGKRFTDPDQAAVLVGRAKRLFDGPGAEGDGDAELTLALCLESVLARGQGDLDGSLRAAQAAVAAADAGSHDARRRVPRWHPGESLHALDRPDAALAALAAAARDASRYAGRLVGVVEAARSAALLSQGQLTEAAAEARGATADASASGDWSALTPARGLRVLIEVAVRQGDLAVARSWLADLRPLLDTERATPHDWWAAALLADAEGDAPQALGRLQVLVGHARSGRYWIGVPEPEHLPQATRIALRYGDIDTASVLADVAAQLVRRNPAVAVINGVAAHTAALVSPEPDPDGFRRAVQLLANGCRPLATASAQEDLGALYAKRDANAQAIALLEATYQTYQHCGATRDTARTRGRLRRLGVIKRQPASARPSHGWESLTASELAVCRLVAEGLTSQHAADRLYLSANTVNTHLRHAFAKLAIRSRVELARLVLEHDVAP
jgi:DNA-binding CsgD family transcriptional regulator/plasmid stability protein